MVTSRTVRNTGWPSLILLMMLSSRVFSVERLSYSEPLKQLQYHDEDKGLLAQPGDQLGFLDVYDPIEPLNRYIFAFDRIVDRNLLKPTVKLYKTVTPVFFRSRVSDFFQNLKEIPSGVNSLLQFDIRQTFNAMFRLVINSTVGFFGLFDPASAIGLHHQSNGFANTLAFYGVGSGAYLVIPLLGPSSVRDIAGMAVDQQLENQINIGNVPETIFQQPEWLVLYGVNYRYTTSLSYSDFSSPFLYDLIRFLYTRKRELEVVIVDDKSI
ncbi:VacJ family lipoprotein [Endozoicomonas sp. OPT23]|uniref:MlaA family lipoprotein n=1 Tax=Endozoicomonas sp. OPT23 TaxID=2072845 RepID=UPI001890F3D6|nr:VacJ family lipoprotein [Endozoicomonas sp. OPT23]